MYQEHSFDIDRTPPTSRRNSVASIFHVNFLKLQGHLALLVDPGDAFSGFLYLDPERDSKLMLLTHNARPIYGNESVHRRPTNPRRDRA